MAIYYALGDALVTEEEVREKHTLGDIRKFAQDLKERPAEARLEFSTGQVTPDNILQAIAEPSHKVVPFEEVGPGKPLTVEIRHTYTGKFPERGGFGGFDRTKDMLVTSAMKSIATFNAASRAVNLLKKHVKARYDCRGPDAVEEGTVLVYYSPALTEKNTILTLELGFDEFPNELFEIVSEGFKQVAGIPLFMSANSYLLGASAITRLLGNIGSRLFDHSPVFKATDQLNFERPGEELPHADFRLILEEDAPKDILENYQVGPEGLIDKDGKRYDGDIPYVIISLDGRTRDEYKSFTTTAASAVLLERFYTIHEGQEKPLGPLVDALKLYNDWTFRQKADKLTEELQKIESDSGLDSKEYKKKKEQYDALIANIQDDLLKPKK